MNTITFKGNPIKTAGALPLIGKPAPEFVLTKSDLSEISKHELLGQRVIMSIFPSLDTPVCATSVRKFNEYANSLSAVKVLCISADLPFAAARFCVAENLSNIITASTFRHPEFGKNFGLVITEGPLKDLMSRAIIILDDQGNVTHAQQVSEITQEPDYVTAIKALS